MKSSSLDSSRTRGNVGVVTSIRPSAIPTEDLEATILGGLVLDISAWSKVSTILSESDFSLGKHRLLMQTLKKGLPLMVASFKSQQNNAKG